VSICLVLFLTFFSINDIYLVSFFIAIIYSGGLVISFMFVISSLLGTGQLISGVLLACYYIPKLGIAFTSVDYVSREVRVG